MRRTVLLALLGATLALPARARDVYVAPSGSNSTGDGSIGNPYRTVAHALTVALPLDAIVLRAGTYAEDVKVTVADVTIRSMDAEQAAIALPTTDPLLPQPMWIDAPGVRLERLELVGGYNYALKIDGDGAVVDRCLAHGAGTTVVSVGRQADDVTVVASEIHTAGLRDPAAGYGIRSLDADRLVLRDVAVHDATATCVETRGGSKGVVFERLRVSRCGSRGILLGYFTADADMDPATNPDWDETTDATVVNSIVEDTAGAGIALYASRRARLVNNTLERVAGTAHGGLLFERVAHAGLDRLNVEPTVLNTVVALGAASVRPLVQIRNASVVFPLLGGTNRWWWAGGAGSFEDSSVTYDLAGWQAHVAGEAGSTEGDPLVSGGHLLAGSPCIDKGTDAGAPSDDHDLDARPLDGDGDATATTDVGADEYVRIVVQLLRGDFSGIAPPAPEKGLVFPLTQVVLSPFASGGSDPTPNILTNGSIPLAVYEVRGTTLAALLVKDLAGGTVVVFLQ